MLKSIISEYRLCGCFLILRNVLNCITGEYNLHTFCFVYRAL